MMVAQETAFSLYWINQECSAFDVSKTPKLYFNHLK